MKVSEYIERIKESNWDSDAEQEWSKMKKKIEAYDNLIFLFDGYDGGLHKYVDDLFCERLPESKIVERVKKIKEIDEKEGIYFASTGDFGDMLEWVLGLHESLAWASDNVKKLLDERKWTDKHTKIVEESEEMFKNHTEGDEVDI